MKVLDLNLKLLEKILSDWAMSMDTLSPEDIYIKIEELKEEKELVRTKVG